MGLHSIGYLFREGIKSLWKNRTMSIASIAVLISCLLLTGVAGLLTLNLSSIMESVESSNTLVVFLEENLPSLEAVKLGEDLRQIDNISECTFVPKNVGLSEMMAGLGSDGALMDALQGTGNPLPDSYRISLADLSRYDETAAAIQSLKGVDRISEYRDIAKKLSNLDRLLKLGSIVIVIVLAVVSLFIISNTVKVTMFSRRMEITIMKSVGATNGFVRIPFLVEGMPIGLISGCVSATVMFFAYGKAVEVIYGIAPFLTIIDISGYVGLIYLAYILVGILFGALGGVISIGKYLKKEGEDAVI